MPSISTIFFIFKVNDFYINTVIIVSPYPTFP